MRILWRYERREDECSPSVVANAFPQQHDEQEMARQGCDPVAKAGVLLALDWLQEHQLQKLRNNAEVSVQLSILQDRKPISVQLTCVILL